MAVLSKLQKQPADRDRIVVLDDQGNADIAMIYNEDDQAFYADSATQDYAVPKADLRAYVGPQGRVYVLFSDPEYIADTQRLAALEKSIVLRHVTHFEKPREEAAPGINIKQILLYVMIGILLLAVIFK